MIFRIGNNLGPLITKIFTWDDCHFTFDTCYLMTVANTHLADTGYLLMYYSLYIKNRGKNSFNIKELTRNASDAGTDLVLTIRPLHHSSRRRVPYVVTRRTVWTTGS